MVFSRLFGKSESKEPASASEAEAPDEELESDDVVQERDADESYGVRARRVIVGGASTGSKRTAALYGGDVDGPTHFVRASGCHVETIEGESLIDCGMALGSVALGYAEPQLTRAVLEVLANGSVAGLSPAIEVEVAERFCGVVPCADRVQFLKTGAEAMSAAVRIARAYTGRQRIIGSGYFGWHDWASDALGVPDATRALFTKVPFNDVMALERAVSEAGDDLAAIIIEPVIEEMADKAWVQRARDLSTSAGAVLIFDEMKTGFRLATGGYQQYAAITPDLAAFGKALANGHALAAVCGSSDVMDAAEKTWISSTLASEAGALAAAASVLAWHERVDVCASLWSIGKEIREVVSAALAASEVTGVEMKGIDPMWFLKFDDATMESRFLELGIANGVLFKRGPYNFAALAHDEDAIRGIEAGASAAFVELREHAG